MNAVKKLALTLLIAALAAACGAGAETQGTRNGTADIQFHEWSWQVSGTCEFAGADMTFNAPGDPLLSIGFTNGGVPTAVGNLSSISERFQSIIGHPDVDTPIVKISGSTYTVFGPFFVEPGVNPQGEITVHCH